MLYPLPDATSPLALICEAYEGALWGLENKGFGRGTPFS